MSPNSDRLLHDTAGVPHPLKTAVVDTVDMPAVHAADVKLAIGGTEASPVDAGTKVSDQRHNCPLRLAGDLVAKDEKVRTCPK